MSDFKPGELIVVVDDDDDAIEILKHAVRRAGLPHLVKGIARGDDALAFVETAATQASDSNRPGLVLLDSSIAGKTSTEFIKAVRSNPEIAELGVVVFSCSEDPVIMRSAYEAGADCFITKPQDYEDLGRLLKRVIRFWLNRGSSSRASQGLSIL